MSEEIFAAFEVGVTHAGELIIGVGNLWETTITPEDARAIAANLYIAAAEAQSIIAAKYN